MQADVRREENMNKSDVYSQTVLVTGATGLVGRPLVDALKARGHTVRTLSRHNGDFRWDVLAGTMDASTLDDVDCVVHLAGEPIAQRWSTKAKQRILESRVSGTTMLADAILATPSRPAFICASGINFYGSQNVKAVDEDSPSGSGFLADVCRKWEEAAAPLIDNGVRVVFVRTGIALSTAGGALAKMLLPFKAGVGGRIGTGAQRMSWIAINDLVAVYIRAVEDSGLAGPINAVAPQSVTNITFTQTLGKILHRPTLFPLPAFVVKILFGEMGTETVLADLDVRPKRLEKIGFAWQTPKLANALQTSLKRAVNNDR